MGSYPKPPAAPRFEHTPETLLKDTHRVIEHSRTLENEIAASVSVETATFENVIKPLVDEEDIMGLDTAILGFYQYVSAEKALRDASSEAEKLLDVSANSRLRTLTCGLVVTDHSIGLPGLQH